MKKYLLVIFAIVLLGKQSSAHEPLYGFGPHVLFKGGLAPHLTLNWNSTEFESEYALGYGITKNWTMVAEAPFVLKNSNYNLNSINFKSKYRFWLKAKQGVSYQGAFISKLIIPTTIGQPTVLNLALTTGQEALKFYWFASVGYGLKFSNESLRPGNNLLYNVSLGYRPFKVNYYKPDIVFFVETVGNIFQKSILNEEKVNLSGGSNLAIAPTFFFTYKNLAIRGGIQFGVWDNGFVSKPETNYKFTFELHI